MTQSFKQQWRLLVFMWSLRFFAWLHKQRRPRSRRGKPLRIALSMGTFNPIHLWHLQVAQCAWDQLDADFVLFIPNGDPPHKDGVVNKYLRYRMVKAGIHGNDRFKASRIEIDRPGKSYTVDTLRLLKTLYGEDTEFCLIIGLDNVDAIKNWRQPEEIFKLCRLAIAPRNTESVTREEIAAVLPPAAVFDIIDCPNSDISSTKIREWIRTGRARSADYVVPNAVRRIIARHKLYLA